MASMEQSHDEAISYFQTALEIDPNFAKAEYHLGILRSERGQLDRAIDHFRRALEIMPDDDDSRRKLEVLMTSRPKGKK